MTELRAGREVGAPHLVEIGRDVVTVEQIPAVYEVVALVHSVFAYVSAIRERSVHLYRLVVVQDL